MLRRSSYVLLLVLLQHFVVSGFQVSHPQTKPNNVLLSNPPRIRAVAASRKNSINTLMATPQEEQAVADFKMITEDEANLRKIGGIILGVVTVAAYFTKGQDYASLSSGAFAAIATYRSGAEYQ